MSLNILFKPQVCLTPALNVDALQIEPPSVVTTDVSLYNNT